MFSSVFDKRRFDDQDWIGIDRFKVSPGAGDKNLNIGVVHIT
jgi:hypothetical protein